MPHLSVEYTKNIESKLNLARLLHSLHASLEGCPGLDINRVKSRLIRHDHVLSGKTANEIQMLHVTLAILSGRDAESKKFYGQTLFDALKNNITLPETSLTVEVREMEKNCYFRN